MRRITNLGEVPWLRDEDDPIATAEWYFPSACGNVDLHTVIWKGQGQPKAILQIAHGMEEHIERYDAFARYVAQHGILVVGNDHLGHGKSVASEEYLGYFGLEEGQDLLVQDMFALTREVRALYPQLPYFLMGHSMGSMLAQLYAVRFPHALTALLLIGPSAHNPLARFMRRSVEKHIHQYGLFSRRCSFEKLLSKLYNARVHPHRTPFDWISSDPVEVDTYIRDPLCGFPFTAAGLRDLLTANILIHEKRWFRSVPKSLPIHFFAGGQDPVGGYGKGVRKNVKKLQHRGVPVTLKVYPTARHELFHDFCRDEAFTDVTGAIFAHIPEKPQS